MRSTRSHAFFLIVAILMVLIVASAYVYMYAALQGSVSDAIAARDDGILEQTRKIQSKDIAALYESTSADRSAVAGSFVPNGQAVSFIESVEAIGPQSGSTLSLSSVSADVLDGLPAGTSGFVRAHVDVSGSWSAVMRALKLSENLPYIVLLDHVRVDTSVLGNSSAKRSWNLSFDIQAPLLPISSAVSSSK